MRFGLVDDSTLTAVWGRDPEQSLRVAAAELAGQPFGSDQAEPCTCDRVSA